MCENGATAEFSEELWGLVNINPNNNAKIKCSIDFKNGTNLIEYLRNLNSSELVEDEYGNLRYIGGNPNNYVSFNNELWRIIGVMKDIENSDGSKSNKVKIIRNESIGRYSWDNKDYGVGSSITGYGSNDWEDSMLMEVLNKGAYYNRTSGECPTGEISGTNIKSCNFTNTGLTDNAKEMISISVWILGGSSNTGFLTPSVLYERERRTNVYSGHATKWTGEVGLVYPSDYGYAVGIGRGTCLTTSMLEWDKSEYCKNNNWLFYEKIPPITLTPVNSDSYNIFYIHSTGKITSSYARSDWNVYPVVYLDSELTLENEEINNGSNTSPFILKQS